MKKLIKSFDRTEVLLLVTFLLMCGVVCAQGEASETSAIDSVVALLITKYPAIGIGGIALFFVSEALAFIPAIKANSVFQLVWGLLKRLFGSKVPK
jgi:energy-converting hydrogenase Eha subunit E